MGEAEKDKKTYEFGNWTLNDILNDPCEREELDGALFRIPDYQRGYAWGKRQREEFWEDLLTLQRNDKSENETESDSGKKGKRHYMGAITVERKKDENGKSAFEVVDGQQLPVYEVVDGQQRLTTIAILLAVLGGHDFCSRFSYGESNENHDFLEKILDGSSPEPSNVYQKNLVEAKSFFSEKVNKLDSVGLSAKEIKTWVVGDSEEGHLEFDFRILRQDHNAGIIFETMNNRGKPLTLLEKLKNRLMYLAEIAMPQDQATGGSEPINQRQEKLRQLIHTTWGGIYGALTYKRDNEFISLDEDEFVAAHLSVYRLPKESVYSEVVAESRLFKMFCAHPTVHPRSESVDETDDKAMEKVKKDGWEDDLSLDKIYRYVEDFGAFAPAWAAIHKQFGNACGRCRLLSGTREVKTFLASVWLALPKNEQGEPNGEDEIFTTTEKLLFRKTISGLPDETTFSTLARRLHGTCRDQRKGDDKEPIDIGKVSKILEEYLNEEKWEISPEDLIGVFSKRMDRQQAPYGFYGWPGLKYFLFTQEAKIGEHSLSWDRFDDVSLEHIIPQSAAEDRYDGWWTEQIKQFVDWPTPTKDEKQKKWRKRALVNSLGNFVLLTRGENSSVSDDPWENYPEVSETHKEVIGKQKFYSDKDKVSSAGARAVAENNDRWNACRVRKRGRELFEKLARQLEVSFQKPNYQDQIDKVLGFEPKFEPNNDLEDKKCRLDEDKVAELAPRLGTGAEPRAPRGATGELYLAFLTQFNEWCRKNGHSNFVDLKPNNKSYRSFGRGEGYSLNFSFLSNLVRIEIYAENRDRDKDKKTKEHINQQTMDRLMAFQADIEAAFTSGIDLRWNDQEEDSTARVARFCRPCDIEHPTDETFRLMVADAKKLVEVLKRHGEDIKEG